MSQTYMTRQRKPAARAEGGPMAAPAREKAAPNSASVSGALNPGMGSQLNELMQARFQQHFLDNQIPAAEREADRLSAGLNARTPDEVKTQLGERMGADFSAVRFHTDASAVNTAEQMGARAYATGRDVYFGQGGFDPAVAAHELVHTVQQGQVESSAPTVSAPTGGVQMMPKLLKLVGNKLNSLKRQHQRAVDDLNNHREDYDKMSWKDRFLWTLKNPLARLMASGSKEDTKMRNKRAKKMEKMAAELPDDVLPKDLGDAAFDPLELAEEPGIGTSVQRDEREARGAEQTAPPATQTETTPQLAQEPVLTQEGDDTDEEVVESQQEGNNTDEEVVESQQEGNNTEEGPQPRPRSIYEQYFQPPPELTLTDDEIKKQEGVHGSSAETMNDTLLGVPKTAVSVGGIGVGLGADNLTDVVRAPGKIDSIKSQMSDYLNNPNTSIKKDDYEKLGKSLTKQEEVAKLSAGERAFGIMGGTLQAGASGMEAAGNIMKAHSQRVKGDRSGAAAHSFYAMGNMADAGIGISKVLGYSGVAPGAIGSKVIPGLGIASGGMKVIGGATQFASASRTKNKMRERMAKMEEEETKRDRWWRNDRDKARLYKTLKQAKHMAAADKWGAGAKALGGALGVTGNAMTLTGIASLAGTVVSGIGTALDVGGGMLAESKKKDARTDVVNEELQLDKRIETLRKQEKYKDLTEREAKHLILKRMGFSSGKRKEAFQRITMRRAVDLYKRANGGDKTAMGVVEDLGISKTGNGYSLQGIAEKLGMESGTSWQEQMKATKESRTHNPFKKKIQAA